MPSTFASWMALPPSESGMADRSVSPRRALGHRALSDPTDAHAGPDRAGTDAHSRTWCDRAVRLGGRVVPRWETHPVQRPGARARHSWLCSKTSTEAHRGRFCPRASWDASSRRMGSSLPPSIGRIARLCSSRRRVSRSSCPTICRRAVSRRCSPPTAVSSLPSWGGADSHTGLSTGPRNRKEAALEGAGADRPIGLGGGFHRPAECRRPLLRLRLWRCQNDLYLVKGLK